MTPSPPPLLLLLLFEQPWEIIPPVNEDEDDVEPEEFAPPQRKLSEYPDFGQRRLSSLFPGMVSRQASTVSIDNLGDSRRDSAASTTVLLSTADASATPFDSLSPSLSPSRRESAAFIAFQKEQTEVAALTTGTAEMRERVSRSCSMLVGLIDFLADGDVTLFGPEDKRDWTRNVLNSFHESGSVASSLSALDGKRTTPTAKIGAAAGLPDATIDAMLGISTDSSSSAVEKKHLSPKEKKRKLDEESAASWRAVVAYMRSLFPGGGMYQGVGIPIDPNALLPQEGGYGDVPMYRKVLELRHTQEIILQRKVGMRDEDLAKRMTSSLLSAFEYDDDSDRGV